MGVLFSLFERETKKRRERREIKRERREREWQFHIVEDNSPLYVI